MMLARPRLPMAGWGQMPMQPQMPMGLQQQIPQVQPGMPQQGMPVGMPPPQGLPQQGMQMPQLPPELLARLQQMQGGLGGAYQPQSSQMGLGHPGIQPLSPASAYSFR